MFRSSSCNIIFGIVYGTINAFFNLDDSLDKETERDGPAQRKQGQ